MKESYSEDLANRADLELYAGDGNIAGVATTEAQAGQPLSSEIIHFRCADLVLVWGRQYVWTALWQVSRRHGGVVDPGMSGNFKRENREVPLVCCPQRWRFHREQQRSGNAQVVPLT